MLNNSEEMEVYFAGKEEGIEGFEQKSDDLELCISELSGLWEGWSQEV